MGKTWTTDAFYRETPDKVALRRSEGCVAVEMEAAAFFAVARFRGVTFAQMLYGGDDVSGEEWDHREWNKRRSVREDLLWLAAEACLMGVGIKRRHKIVVAGSAGPAQSRPGASGRPTCAVASCHAATIFRKKRRRTRWRS